MEPVVAAAITSSSILGGVQLFKFIHSKFGKNGKAGTNGNGTCKYHAQFLQDITELKVNVSYLKTYHEEADLKRKLELLIEKVSARQS